MKGEHFECLFNIEIDKSDEKLAIVSTMLKNSRYPMHSCLFYTDFSSYSLQLLLIFCNNILKNNIYAKDWSDLLVLRNK